MRAFFPLLLLIGSAVALYTKDGKIYNEQGEQVTMQGIHLFGLNTDANAAGIDIRADKPQESAYVDWKTVVWRNRQLGFNAVRLPFNFFYLDKPMEDYTVPCNVTSRDNLIKGVTPPNVSTTGKKLFSEPPTVKGGICNNGMPDTYLERLVWSICYITSQDMYVVIDHHLDYSQRGNTSLPLRNLTQLVDNYKTLVSEVVAQNCSRDHFIVDFINEPDATGYLWEGTKNMSASLADTYKALLTALVPICDDCLYFLEGTDQWRWQVLASWGDGFATNPTLVNYSTTHWTSLVNNATENPDGYTGMTTPSKFFDWLLSKPQYLSQVVLAPHVYCPRVTLATSHFSGPTLWRRITDSFGYLTYEGYTSSTGKNYVFPVVLGELGTGFGDDNEKACYASIAQWMANQGDAAVGYAKEPFMAAYGDAFPIYSGKHATIDSWMWWVWNPNSDDTGGILGDDWETISMWCRAMRRSSTTMSTTDWDRIAALTGEDPSFNGSSLSLTPWYKATAASVAAQGRL